MQKFANRKFECIDDRDSAALFKDVEFQHCHFDNCRFGITYEPRLRTTIRNVSLVDCTENGSTIGTAILEEINIHNLRAPGLFQTFGAVFKHVNLSGKLDRLMFSNDCLPRSDVNAPYQYENVEAFRQANAEYYQHVDWALNISKGEFRELDIRGIPGHLIRRDPETQVLVNRQRVVDFEWHDIPFETTFVPFVLDFMLRQELPDILVIAAKRHPEFRDRLRDLRLLRSAGLTEPD